MITADSTLSLFNSYLQEIEKPNRTDDKKQNTRVQSKAKPQLVAATGTTI